MTTVGLGVKEIRIRESEGIYRVIYVARFSDNIFVLNAFQKKSEKTELEELKLARKRFREITQ
jgi:phage-related protein